jgi:predicted RNA-binding Zn ribbon-like protein
VTKATASDNLMEKARQIARLPRIGGALCLDFTNTVTGLREGEHEHNHLHSYADLIAFALNAEAIGASTAAALLMRARDDAGDAERIVEQALRLRDTIHDVFASIAHAANPASPALDALNIALGDALHHARVLASNGGLAWGWNDLAGRLEGPLWPVLRSAADLLTAGMHHRIKQCPFPHCGWLFFDHSKNNSRRWCEMRVCGNRTKARRHYMRERLAMS